MTARVRTVVLLTFFLGMFGFVSDWWSANRASADVFRAVPAADLNILRLIGSRPVPAGERLLLVNGVRIYSQLSRSPRSSDEILDRLENAATRSSMNPTQV